MRVKPIVEDGVVRISLPHMKTSHATCYEMLSADAARALADELHAAARQVEDYAKVQPAKLPYSPPEIKSKRKWNTVEEANAALDDYRQEMKALPEAVKRRAEELALEEEKKLFNKNLFEGDGKEIKPMPLLPEGMYRFEMPKLKDVKIDILTMMKLCGIDKPRRDEKPEDKPAAPSKDVNPIPEF